MTKNPALLPQGKLEMAGFRNREAVRLNCYRIVIRIYKDTCALKYFLVN